MKKDIHPKYTDATISCGCGNRIETRSTKEDVHIEICSKCHPFYSGKAKLVDTAGRIEKFQKRFKMKEGESSVERHKQELEKRAQKRNKKGDATEN